MGRVVRQSLASVPSAHWWKGRWVCMGMGESERREGVVWGLLRHGGSRLFKSLSKEGSRAAMEFMVKSSKVL